MTGLHHPTSMDRRPAPAPNRHVDPLCAAVWGFVPIAVVVFAVGIITILRWVF